MSPGIFFFGVAVVCLVIRIIAHIHWIKGIDRYLGEWFYDGEHDMTFWQYYPEIEEAMKELDKEFPGNREGT